MVRARTALVASRMELRGVMMMPGATTAASRTAVGEEYSSGFTCRPPHRHPHASPPWAPAPMRPVGNLSQHVSRGRIPACAPRGCWSSGHRHGSRQANGGNGFLRHEPCPLCPQQHTTPLRRVCRLCAASQAQAFAPHDCSPSCGMAAWSALSGPREGVGAGGHREVEELAQALEAVDVHDPRRHLPPPTPRHTPPSQPSPI